MNINKRFPSVAYLEAAALPRLPKFVRDYLTGGLGTGTGVLKNRQALNDVELMPLFLAEADQPDMQCTLFGRTYGAPFGVAPMGLTGLIWPNAETILAEAAHSHNIPYTLSTVSTLTLEETRQLTGEVGWFQLYTPKDIEARHDILRRCEEAGYDTLLVTVDVPYQTRREHDIRNGLSVPPQFDLKTLWQMVTHPPWALRMARVGVPQFANLTPYYGKVTSRSKRKQIEAQVQFIKDRIGLHITKEVFGDIREHWKGKLLAKGVLDPREAVAYLDHGADGIVVSNHGGRQLDAAPGAAAVLPAVREAVGPDATLLVDSGVRSGLDIARMLALGANFVMMGRPFMYGVAALDRLGGDHVMNILKAELQSTMGHLGCQTIDELPARLVNGQL
jgi:L-lactate dehydrogenase (cytochrome)